MLSNVLQGMGKVAHKGIILLIFLILGGVMGCVTQNNDLLQKNGDDANSAPNSQMPKQNSNVTSKEKQPAVTSSNAVTSGSAQPSGSNQQTAITPEKLMKIRSYMQSVNIHKINEQMTEKVIIPRIRGSLASCGIGLSREKADKLRDKIATDVLENKDLDNFMEKHLDQHYTESELMGLTEFLRSPEGQKLVQNSTSSMNDLLSSGEFGKLMQSLLTELQMQATTLISDEIKAGRITQRK